MQSCLLRVSVAHHSRGSTGSVNTEIRRKGSNAFYSKEYYQKSKDRPCADADEDPVSKACPALCQHSRQKLRTRLTMG